ncbi:MAG: hypothetical protein KIH63_002095 [Candidatus Saccharibacteria bacterium]|nr:hypothetical protein [Candidatus Saccharibacteria bacterium]
MSQASALKELPGVPVTPDTVKIDVNYYRGELAAANDRLDQALTMTDAEAAAAAFADYEASLRWRQEAAEHSAAITYRYSAMLDQVLAWEPPTPAHEPLRDLMAAQLTHEIVYDGSVADIPGPTLRTADEQRARMQAAAWGEITRATDQIVRISGLNYDRSRWVEQLQAGLPQQTTKI